MKKLNKGINFGLPFFIFSFLLLLSLSGFAFAGEAPSNNIGSFEAEISGAYSGKVSGKGVLKLIPPGGFRKRGSFFLADGSGIRPHGVTFVLPKDLNAGKYELENPSPFDMGTVPSVRVDRDMGNSVDSFEKNTKGFLELTAFPKDKEKIKGSPISGNFQFSTEDKNGKKIAVKGSFSFSAQ